MAKSSLFTDVVVQTTHTVKLDLSMQEAIALRSLLAVVGGAPVTSARKFIWPIADALDDAGVQTLFDITTPESAVEFADHSDVAVIEAALGEGAEVLSGDASSEDDGVDFDDAEYGT